VPCLEELDDNANMDLSETTDLGIDFNAGGMTVEPNWKTNSGMENIWKGDDYYDEDTYDDNSE